MKLYYSPTSPFVRKVMITALEDGLDGRIEKINTSVNPTQPNTQLAGQNPLMKLPTLITDDGVALIESKVICQYLDGLAGNRLCPFADPKRWAILRLEAIADGLTDAGLLMRFETTMRPETLRWAAWVAGQRSKVTNALQQLEREWDGVAPAPLHLGHIATACALTWLEFRNVVPEARSLAPTLFAWTDRMNRERPSFASTLPQA